MYIYSLSSVYIYICMYIYIYIVCIYIYIYMYIDIRIYIRGLTYVSFIPLQSCDYLKQTSLKTNVATEEGNSRNET